MCALHLSASSVNCTMQVADLLLLFEHAILQSCSLQSFKCVRNLDERRSNHGYYGYWCHLQSAAACSSSDCNRAVHALTGISIACCSCVQHTYACEPHNHTGIQVHANVLSTVSPQRARGSVSAAQYTLQGHASKIAYRPVKSAYVRWSIYCHESCTTCTCCTAAASSPAAATISWCGEAGCRPVCVCGNGKDTAAGLAKV